MKRIILLLIYIHLSIFFIHMNLTAQPLSGITGLITIPTAKMSTDGKISFSVNFTDRKYNVRLPDKYHQYSYFFTLGYLPFAEVSLRLTHHYKYPKEQALGDRSPSVKIRLLKENKYHPAIALGIQDFLGECRHFNALYAVASKTLALKIKSFSFQTEFHLGYGTDKIDARHHQFAGIFGGLSVEFFDIISLMAEYDSEKFNGGIGFDLFNHIQVLFALLHFDSFSCGASFSLTLPNEIKKRF